MVLLPEYDDVANVLVAIVCGSVIGIEREIKNKAAGFRTVVLICLGSAVFTMVSGFGSTSDDRIAANIITGIGFIGAGVIFKNKVSVQGLTTAAVIWISAGIGMVSGSGYYPFAFTLTVCTLIILTVFSRIEGFLAYHYWTATLVVTFEDTAIENVVELQQVARGYGIRTKRKTIGKSNGKLTLVMEVSGKRQKIADFNDALVNSSDIMEFTYS